MPFLESIIVWSHHRLGDEQDLFRNAPLLRRVTVYSDYDIRPDSTSLPCHQLLTPFTFQRHLKDASFYSLLAVLA